MTCAGSRCWRGLEADLIWCRFPPKIHAQGTAGVAWIAPHAHGGAGEACRKDLQPARCADPFAGALADVGLRLCGTGRVGGLHCTGSPCANRFDKLRTSRFDKLRTSLPVAAYPPHRAVPAGGRHRYLCAHHGAKTFRSAAPTGGRGQSRGRGRRAGCRTRGQSTSRWVHDLDRADQ